MMLCILHILCPEIYVQLTETDNRAFRYVLPQRSIDAKAHIESISDIMLKKIYRLSKPQLFLLSKVQTRKKTTTGKWL